MFPSKKGSFAEAFPQIAHVTIEVTEDGKPRGTYDETFVGEFVNCKNPLCYNGGFSVGRILREMVRARETERRGSATCQGYNGSPKGKRSYGPCSHFFGYHVLAIEPNVLPLLQVMHEEASGKGAVLTLCDGHKTRSLRRAPHCRHQAARASQGHPDPKGAHLA